MSGEMLVISFVREVNHVIMAATLDSRQMPANNTSNFANELLIHPCYGIGYTFSVGNHDIGYNPVSLELSDMA